MPDAQVFTVTMWSGLGSFWDPSKALNWPHGHVMSIILIHYMYVDIKRANLLQDMTKYTVSLINGINVPRYSATLFSFYRFFCRFRTENTQAKILRWSNFGAKLPAWTDHVISLEHTASVVLACSVTFFWKVLQFAPSPRAPTAHYLVRDFPCCNVGDSRIPPVHMRNLIIKKALMQTRV